MLKLLLLSLAVAEISEECRQQTEVFGVLSGSVKSDISYLRSTDLNEKTKVQKIVFCGANDELLGMQLLLTTDYTDEESGKRNLLPIGVTSPCTPYVISQYDWVKKVVVTWTSFAGIKAIQVQTALGESFGYGQTRVTDRQDIVEFTKTNRLIGLTGYENKMIKALGFFTNSCAEAVIDPNLVEPEPNYTLLVLGIVFASIVLFCFMLPPTVACALVLPSIGLTAALWKKKPLQITQVNEDVAEIRREIALTQIALEKQEKKHADLKGKSVLEKKQLLQAF